MNGHDERHEIALAELLADDTHDAGALARVAECAECAEQLEEMRGVAVALDTMQHEREQILAQSRFAPRTPRATVAAAARAAGYRTSRPRWPLLVAAPLAAAALVAIAFVMGRDGGRDTPLPANATRPTLGPHDLQCLAPLGTVRSIDAFEWHYALRAGESFTLVIFDASRPGEHIEIARFSDLKQTTQPVTPELASKLTARIGWEVQVVGDTGDVRGQDDVAEVRVEP